MTGASGDPVDVPAEIPIVDIAPLMSGPGDREAVATGIGRACRDQGFFYIVGHGVNEELIERLDEMSREFFAQELETKLAIRMELGGRAWRGFFPVGAELTRNQVDQKEGLYFGEELGSEDPRVASRTPLHGPNLFPAIPGFREAVLDYMGAMTRLGHMLMEGVALSLGLDAAYFHDRYTRDPLVLFRIFHYPPLPSTRRDDALWSVGEHTDYGVLTILRQDSSGGLQVKSGVRWVDAPPVPGSLVCNIGDMLDRMTGGFYRSTPHRVRNRGDRGRLSFPFFFDPNFDAEVEPIDPGRAIVDDRDERWDRASVHEFSGTYGDYVLGKVSKVFPQLRDDVL